MKIFSYLLLLSLLTFSFKPSFSQLIVGTVATPEELAGSLVGSGVTITNVTLNCPNGGWGSFDGTNSNIGIDSGIILACGSINNAVGPNFSGGITTAFGTTGDQDLTDLAGQETHDACVLEFDLAASSDSINFSYVFASDEYTEYVNSINDIFAFFISGPGITGEQNIALVPGTTDPVAINTVNCLNGSLYYICNDPLNSQCDATYNCPTDASLTTIEYDGFTTVLTAVANVQPCQTYHLKLAIADASDEILDSGVFIKASSLSTAASSVTVSTPYNDPITNLPAVVEGCFSATVEVQTCNPSTDSVALHYTISGTATNGTDYNQIADSIFIPPGLSSANLIIDPLVDGVSESSETVTLYFYSTSPSNPYDSVTILILDSLIAIASPDTVICVGQSASLTVNDA
ncbi:MAG: choice-of-anchor L domain-containing protein, partial [Chitinophagales bacterium]|nr:choice-of-anchor L domain-containing protein [Chitinophagales bacterium]